MIFFAVDTHGRKPVGVYALAYFGSAVITDRSKEFTDSGDWNTEATSGSNTISTVGPSSGVQSRLGDPCGN